MPVIVGVLTTLRVVMAPMQVVAMVIIVPVPAFVFMAVVMAMRRGAMAILSITLIVTMRVLMIVAMSRFRFVAFAFVLMFVRHIFPFGLLKKVHLPIVLSIVEGCARLTSRQRTRVRLRSSIFAHLASEPF
jgi:hypothetical protein